MDLSLQLHAEEQALLNIERINRKKFTAKLSERLRPSCHSYNANATHQFKGQFDYPCQLDSARVLADHGYPFMLQWPALTER